MELSTDCLYDLNWWLQNISKSGYSLAQRNYSYKFFSDASSSGWGAVCLSQKTGGFWNKDEARYHINYLELLATFYALKSFVKNELNLNILLKVDNITAIA